MPSAIFLVMKHGPVVQPESSTPPGNTTSSLPSSCSAMSHTGAGADVEQQILSPVANDHAMATAGEVGIAADLGPRVALFLLVGERDPGRGIVALHAGPALGNGLPHLIAGPAAEVGIDDAREHQVAGALELGDLALGEAGSLRDGWGRTLAWNPVLVWVMPSR